MSEQHKALCAFCNFFVCLRRKGKKQRCRAEELTVRAESVPDFVLADSGEPERGIRLHLARRDQDRVVTAAINTMIYFI